MRAYASGRGLSPEEATTLSQIVIVVVALSALVHGITVTPIMRRYSANRAGRQRRSQARGATVQERLEPAGPGIAAKR